MYLHNTTFVVVSHHAPKFEEWARETYIPAARRSGRFDRITMTRILTEISPESTNYTIQMESNSLESSEQWHNDVATLLKDDITARLGNGNVMFFSTDMEILSE